MKTYWVKSGDLEARVRAKNLDSAVIRAIDKDNPKALGLIVEVRDITSRKPARYMNTEAVLKRAGRWSDS